MNTNSNDILGLQSECEKLKSEILVGKSVVEGARDKYAQEIGAAEAISRMKDEARIKNKTYKLPKKVRRHYGLVDKLMTKIKVVFGIDG